MRGSERGDVGQERVCRMDEAGPGRSNLICAVSETVLLCSAMIRSCGQCTRLDEFPTQRLIDLFTRLCVVS